jgi:hypothetical protein
MQRNLISRDPKSWPRPSMLQHRPQQNAAKSARKQKGVPARAETPDQANGLAV